MSVDCEVSATDILLDGLSIGLENIMILWKIPKYRNYNDSFDTYRIFSIFMIFFIFSNFNISYTLFRLE
jgi:hypothetical protein